MALDIAADQRIVTAFPFVVDHLDVSLPGIESLSVDKGTDHLAHLASIADAFFDKNPRFLSILKHTFLLPRKRDTHFC